MAESNLVRWGGLAAVGAGVLYILYFLIGLATGKGEEDPGALDILPILFLGLQVVGLLGFHALQGRHYGRIGRAGLYTTIGAIAALEIQILAALLQGSDAGLGWLAIVGILGTLVGFVLYGAATSQARVLPRWCGILLILLMPVGFLFGLALPVDLSEIWSGLVWLALGYALFAQSSSVAATQRSSRVQ